MGSMSDTTEMGRLQDFTIDQAAGATALVLGSIGALLAVIWRSKCHCRVNLCWLFQCERRPPVETGEEEEGTELCATKSVNKFETILTNLRQFDLFLRQF